VIPGSGGIRKIRWEAQGRGKRSGVRVIYFWASAKGHLLMLYVYSKSESADLTKEQVRHLRQLVEEEFR
jgi:hypothetical protein